MKKFTISSKTFVTAIWFCGLIVLIGTGLFAGGIVLTQGLSATNLTDLVPWGLWITIDLSSIAMAAGAFSLCALVYLVGLKEYEPIARTATFIGITGYTMAMLCLLMDIGRPDRFWHGFVFWNVHSVLWEVTMCVGLYFSVLLIETLPIIGESEWMQRAFPKIANLMTRLHHYSPVLAIFGLGFSLLHQSSLGATYGVLQAKPIWYRPNLSVLFIFSAVLGGISITLFASMISAQVSRFAKVKDHLIEKLSKAVGWALLGYIYFRFWDMFAVNYTYQPGRTEGLQMLTKGSLAFNFWIGEVLLGMLIPVVILLKDNLRSQKNLRMFALLFIAAGVVAYRWNTNMVGQLIVMSYLPHQIVPRYTQYFPSLIEVLSGAGVVAIGLMTFSLGVRFLNIVNHDHVHHPHEVKIESPVPGIPEIAGMD